LLQLEVKPGIIRHFSSFQCVQEFGRERQKKSCCPEHYTVWSAQYSAGMFYRLFAPLTFIYTWSKVLNGAKWNCTAAKCYSFFSTVLFVWCCLKHIRETMFNFFKCFSYHFSKPALCYPQVHRDLWYHKGSKDTIQVMSGFLDILEWAALLFPSFVSILGQAAPSPSWNTSGSRCDSYLCCSSAEGIHSAISMWAPTARLGAWTRVHDLSCPLVTVQLHHMNRVTSQPMEKGSKGWTEAPRESCGGWALSLHRDIKSFQDRDREVG